MRILAKPSAARRAAVTAYAMRNAPRRAQHYTADGAAVAAYRHHGHLHAKVDPIAELRGGQDTSPVLRQYEAREAGAALKDLLERVYCGAIGSEFEHLESGEERDWWALQLETRVPAAGSDMSPSDKRQALLLLQSALEFETFLGKKFTSFKRYSGEGTETLLPLLDQVFRSSAEAGVSRINIGQAHRGRLALLVSLLDYPARKLFWKIAGHDDFPASVAGLDDVSSHISQTTEKKYRVNADGSSSSGSGGAGTTASVKVTLLPNPSHLEAVNPVAVGKTRAAQDAGTSACCVLIHGDGAVIGQGIVAETYAMASLPGYSVGGTIHVITNNNVSFTASGTSSARSSRYASDMAKIIGAPVLHVNAESLHDVLLCGQLAVEYRTRFGRDVVIDLIGYRKYGHNEVDEPAFTLPDMYRAIRARKPYPVEYADQLEAEGLLTKASRAAMVKRLHDHLEAEFAASKTQFTPTTGSLGEGKGAVGSGTHVVADGTAFGGRWATMRQATAAELATSPATGVDAAALQRVGLQSVSVPTGFHVHDRLVRSHLQARATAMTASVDDAVVDFATAEALAFGTLMLEGNAVRLSGQDSARGTFSHRHAALVDQSTGAVHMPLSHLTSADGRKAAPFNVYSSLLSELGVLGFELGYSWYNPKQLVLWEAQFGDFANGAQLMIDTFITSCESKWLRQSGLVMLLPHGYDGAGPEHSSARIERFLQMVNSQAWARGAACVTDPAAVAADKSISEPLNFLVANPTTPANYFHLLRRQCARPFRKPLVVAAPKTLLRHQQALSSLADMGPGTAFQPVLMDPSAPVAAATERVLLCSGKVWLDLAGARAKHGSKAKDTTAIVRIEELAPFPTDTIVSYLRGLGSSGAGKGTGGPKEVVWVQEEPANAGAWTWAEAHLSPALAAAGLPPLRYIGRPALAAPAVGLSKFNATQQAAILHRAFPAA